MNLSLIMTTIGGAQVAEMLDLMENCMSSISKQLAICAVGELAVDAG